MKTQQNSMNEATQTSESTLSAHTLSFGDVVVYNEMADQTSVKMNLIEQIHAQLNQLETMNHKRRFMMKEILESIS